jgi:hypothetical protein
MVNGQLQAVVVGEAKSFILLRWHCQGLLFNQPLDEEPGKLGWLPTSLFRGCYGCTTPGYCCWWYRQPHPPRITLPGPLVQSATGWRARDVGMTAHQFLQGLVVLLQAVVVGKADSLILLGWHRQGLLSNQQMDEEPEMLGWLPTSFRGPTELKGNHSQWTGGFFASAVLILASFGGFSSFFLAISNFDPFYGRSNFVRSNFDRSNFDPRATLTRSNFDP